MRHCFARILSGALLLVSFFCLSIAAAAAYVLPLNGSGTGALSQAQSTVDWQVTTPADGRLTVTVTTSSTLDANILLLDTNGTSGLASDGEYGTFSTVTQPNLAPGTYTIRITVWSGVGTYTIADTFTPQPIPNDPEPDNTVAAAVAMGQNSQATGHLGYYYYGYTDSMDNFAIDFSGGPFTMTVITDPTLEVNITFLASDGITALGVDYGSGTNSIISLPSLNAGRYYLRVSRVNGYGGYRIFPPEYQPDLQIAGAGGDFRGENIYDDLTAQTLTQSGLSVQTVVYRLTVQNDGTQPDSITITGAPSGSGYLVRYYNAFSGGTLITSAVTSSDGWTTPLLAPGAMQNLRVEIVLYGSVPGGATRQVDVTAQSVNDPTRTDAVRAIACKILLSAVALAASPAAPRPVNTYITLTASATGGGTIQYRFLAGYASGQSMIWTVLRTWGVTNTCTWDPHRRARLHAEGGRPRGEHHPCLPHDPGVSDHPGALRGGAIRHTGFPAAGEYQHHADRHPHRRRQRGI